MSSSPVKLLVLSEIVCLIHCLAIVLLGEADKTWNVLLFGPGLHIKADINEDAVFGFGATVANHE